jgi:phenylacetic acid degradation protein paaN
MSETKDHTQTLHQAIDALHLRTFFSCFPELPSPEVYGAASDRQGQEAFEHLLHQRFNELQQPGPAAWAGQEESPFTQQPLGISYPCFPVHTLADRAQAAFHTWRQVPRDTRATLLLQTLDQLRARFFELAYATMHTTGQSFLMAFQAAGPNAADRALEAIAAGFEELTRFPEEATWEKPMGKYNLKVQKTWKAVPKGVALAIGCSTFPTWNTLPGLYASLITGNAVIVKPHPKAVLPIAIVVAEIQKALAEKGLDPLICQLAVDPDDHLITRELAEHPAVKLIDYTGNTAFGNYLESLPHKTVFTEKAGVNSVILDSMADLDKVAQNLAFSLCLYSGQMCTAPQNLLVPAGGVRVGETQVPYETVVEKLTGALNGLIRNQLVAPQVLGAIQDPATLERVKAMASQPGRQLLTTGAVANPLFANARVCAPVLYEVDAAQPEVYSQELFGPIALVIKTESTDHSISLAKTLAQQQGAITCGAYTTDAATREKIMDEMGLAGTPVSFNLTGNIYLNQNASFSDFHVTGGNPAGNASFTNPEFVVKRFTWVGFREAVPSS